MTSEATVAIVGMGPVGATLALLLGQAGVATVVVEREASVVPFPRAVALDGEALLVLQAAGLDRDGRPPLLADPGVRIRSGAGDPLIELPPGRYVNGHPALTFFHQPELERDLRSAIARQPSVRVLLEHEVERFVQDPQGVRVDVRDRRTGSTGVLRADWLIGCDGAGGHVRRALGIRLRGFTSRHRWLVVDTRRRHAVEPAPFEFICDPARPRVSAPLPRGLHRWEFMLLPGEDPTRMERLPHARALVAQWANDCDLDLLRATAYTFHARIAERWSTGRVFLAGDAAHLSPPFAGLGLSSGLRDAHNLAWKLMAVTRGEASPALLQTYEVERRPDATRLVALAVALGAFVQARRRPLVAFRDAGIRGAASSPTVQRWIAEERWKPTRTYRRGLVHPRRRRRPGEGEQFPQPVVQFPGAGERRLDEVLGMTFSIVAWMTSVWAALDGECWRTLTAHGGRVYRIDTDVTAGNARMSFPCGPEVVLTARGDRLLDRWFARAGMPLALLRPDRHVFAVFQPGEAHSVLAELSRQMRGG